MRVGKLACQTPRESARADAVRSDCPETPVTCMTPPGRRERADPRTRMSRGRGGSMRSEMARGPQRDTELLIAGPVGQGPAGTMNLAVRSPGDHGRDRAHSGLSFRPSARVPARCPGRRRCTASRSRAGGHHAASRAAISSPGLRPWHRSGGHARSRPSALAHGRHRAETGKSGLHRAERFGRGAGPVILVLGDRADTLRPVISTGSISAANLSAAWAAAKRACERSAQRSCAARLIWYFAARFSVCQPEC